MKHPAPFPFLTLNSGHTMIVPPGAVDPSTIALLRPLIQAGGGPVPKFAKWTFKVTNTIGGSLITISFAGADVVLCAVAWEQPGADEVWQSIVKVHNKIWGSLNVAGLKPEPARPKTLPWLAITLLPDLIKQPQAGMWLADFEKCVAWTILVDA